MHVRRKLLIPSVLVAAYRVDVKCALIQMWDVFGSKNILGTLETRHLDAFLEETSLKHFFRKTCETFGTSCIISKKGETFDNFDLFLVEIRNILSNSASFLKKQTQFFEVLVVSM